MKSYLVFVEVESPSRKTRRWKVNSTNGTLLGWIAFWPSWRCYVFHPEVQTLYNAGCMTDLATFCDEQTQAWRKSLDTKSTK